jgi:thioredoxin 1
MLLSPNHTLTYLGVFDWRIFSKMSLTHVSSTKDWQAQVIDSAKPVFVDFWAEWCGPCRMVGPVVEELAHDYEGKVNFVKVNVDEANELAAKYNIFSIPTLMILNKGQVVAQQVGAASKEAYKNMIERALSKS